MAKYIKNALIAGVLIGASYLAIEEVDAGIFGRIRERRSAITQNYVESKVPVENNGPIGEQSPLEEKLSNKVDTNPKEILVIGIRSGIAEAQSLTNLGEDGLVFSSNFYSKGNLRNAIRGYLGKGSSILPSDQYEGKDVIITGEASGYSQGCYTVESWANLGILKADTFNFIAPVGGPRRIRKMIKAAKEAGATEINIYKNRGRVPIFKRRSSGANWYKYSKRGKGIRSRGNITRIRGAPGEGHSLNAHQKNMTYFGR